MQALIDERESYNAKIRNINMAIYAIFMTTRVDKAHGYIQEKRATIGDIYYLVATDIADRLLSNFPGYYTRQCVIKSPAIITPEIYTDIDCSDPNSCVEYFMSDDHVDHIYLGNINRSATPEIIEAVESGKLHIFNLLLADGIELDEIAIVNIDNYVKALFIDEETLTHKPYTEVMEIHHKQCEETRFNLRIPLTLIKCTELVTGAHTKAVVDF